MFRKKSIIITILVSGLFACSPQDDSQSVGNPGGQSKSPLESYNGLLGQATKTAIDFECEDDLISGQFFLRSNGDLKVYQYSTGFEHGSVFLDVFTENNEIRIVKYREEIWKFDENEPSGEATATEPPISHTVDEAKEYLYNVSDKKLVKAQIRSAAARSIKNESIETNINNATWSEFAGDAFSIHYKAGSELIESFDKNKIKSDWCGLNLN